MPEEFEFEGFRTLAENIEETILTSIREGISSGEHRGLRPLREVFQNCDDELSDRFYIQIAEDALYFLNDGHRLTVEFNQGGDAIGGTTRMITGIALASKKKDRGRAGEFGTGLRSAHSISHTIEVTGRITRFDHTGNNPDGTPKFELSSKQQNKFYTGISNAYNKNLKERNIDGYPFGVREENNRPKRRNFPTQEVERDGIMVRLPWRRQVEHGSNDPEEWNEYTWDNEGIKYLFELYAKEIPRILLGCSWLREVVLEIDMPNKKQCLAWTRDFNQREISSDGIIDATLTTYQDNNKLYGLQEGLCFSIQSLKKIKSDKFRLISLQNKDLDGLANDADLLPNIHLLMPMIPESNMPAYVPIALVGDSGNSFGPTAYLPPDGTRTKIKVDGAKKVRQLWAAKVIERMTTNLLPILLEESLRLFSSSSSILKLLPRTRTDKWYTSGEGMNKPHSSHAFGENPEISKNIPLAWDEMEESWNEYKHLVSKTPLFSHNTGNILLPANKMVRLNIPDKKIKSAIRRLFDKLSIPTISDENVELLHELHDGDWGSEHPLLLMNEVSNPRELNEILSPYAEELSLSKLGSSLVKDLIQILCIDAQGVWASEDSKLIPTIPDASGKLWPLRDENGESHFYSASDKFPDLLPTNRQLHPDFIKISQKLDFKEAPAHEIAKLVDEAADEKPEIYSDLGKYKSIHSQVSAALVAIVNSDLFQLKSLHQYKFIPCLQNGKIFVRRPNHIGEFVWDVSDGFPQRNWENHTHRDFIFADDSKSREELKLHRIIQGKIIWLELHKNFHEDIEDIRKALRIHKVTPQVRGIGLIRALIFAEDGNGLNKVNPISIFHRHEDGEWELEKWIERSLSPKEIDEALTSVLQLLSDKKTLSGGWGASPKEKLKSLYLLKDESGEWSRVDELCLELPQKLSNLFERRTLFTGHKSLLPRTLLANEMPTSANNSGGLGVPERLGEDVILSKIQTLDGTSTKTRSTIVQMMLESEIEWQLIELDSIEWVPRLDGNVTTFEKCLLPTPEITNLFGNNHPWYIDCKIDSKSKNLISRASELGIMHDHKDTITVHSALVDPDTLWPDMVGKNVLQMLKKSFNKDPDSIYNRGKSPRLPDPSTDEWHDDSWLVSSQIVEDMRKVFPNNNIVGSRELGLGNKGLEMVKSWILPEPCEPTFSEIVEQFSNYCSKSKIEKTIIQSYWNILNFHHLNGDSEPIPGDDLLFPIEEKLPQLRDIVLSEKSQLELFSDDVFSEISNVRINDKYADTLKNFGVIDLHDGTNFEELTNQIRHMREEEKFDQSSVQKYWLIIGNYSGRTDKLFKEDFWLFHSATGFGFCNMGHDARSNPKALIPEIDDTEDVIRRMAKDKLPLLWLPRSGKVMLDIYKILEDYCNRQDGPKLFLRQKAKAKPKGIDKKLAKKKWPVLQNSIQNIINALNIISKSGEGELMQKVNKVAVYRTEERIKSELSVRLSRGASEVYWKDISNSRGILAELNQENSTLEITIDSNQENIDDNELINQITQSIICDRELITKLVESTESNWGAEIYPILGEQDWENPRTDSGLLYQATRHEITQTLAGLYGQCQVCKRITPYDRKGKSQESVVSLFKQTGGRYYSTGLVEELGNFVYLCPNHSALYRRSKSNALLWFPQIDEAIDQIKNNKSQAESIIDAIVSKLGKSIASDNQITLRVVTYEKQSDDGKEKPQENSGNFTWKGKHAVEFRDALTKYLYSLV